jgi:intein-encoded DNA endonuclease-like protein
MPILKKYDKDFFKTWNANMAYIVGFLYADGNIVKTKRGTHYVSWYTADKDLLISMKSIMQAEHLIKLRESTAGKVYRMQVGSLEWYNDLSKLGLTPNKTKRLVLPSIPKDYIGHFVRGFFDGDGNVWVGQIHKNRDSSTKTIQVAFTSASYDFLSSLLSLLRSFGLAGGSIYTVKTGTYSRLSFSVRDALKIYKIMYNAEHELLLRRKKQVFEKFFNCGGSSTG